VYLLDKKSFYFIENMDFIGFIGGIKRLRLLVKHLRRIVDFLSPTFRAKLNTFS